MCRERGHVSSDCPRRKFIAHIVEEEVLEDDANPKTLIVQREEDPDDETDVYGNDVKSLLMSRPVPGCRNAT